MFKAIVEIPLCKPTLRHCKFKVPGKYEIELTAEDVGKTTVLTIVLRPEENYKVTIKEIAKELKWLINHVKGYCTENV